MDDAQALLTRLYDAYNRRDLPDLSAMLTPDVDWPNLMEGGRLVGQQALRDYWVQNDKYITVDTAPVGFAKLADSRMAVDVNQIVRNLSGHIWSDTCVRHVFTLRDGLVARLDVEAHDERG